MDIKRNSNRYGWSIGFEAPRFGVALLFYRPERRLSWSIWGKTWSRNFRLWGPKKLSFEKQ